MQHSGSGGMTKVIRVAKPRIRVPRNKKDGIRASTVRLSLQITYAGVVLPRGLVNMNEREYLSERKCWHLKEATTTGFE